MERQMDSSTKPSSTKPPMTPAEVGMLVKIYRDAMEWSQETLAELSGVTVRTVQRIEAGQPSSLDSRRAIARGFESPDLDVFCKPTPFPTAEELEAQRAAFDREHIVLDAMKADGRKTISLLMDSPGYGAIGPGSTVDLPRPAQDAYAAILDYVQDCMDISDVASRTDMLGYGDFLDELLVPLHSAGYCLCAARRDTSVTNKSWINQTAMPMSITYLIAAPIDATPSKLAVSRKLGQPTF
jgi:transcriptional regulator with XRE-family HTH domain